MFSDEFAEWLGAFALEAEMNDTNREPEPDELMEKFRGWAEASQALAAATGKVKPVRTNAIAGPQTATPRGLR